MEILTIRANNPGPMTGDGTNTYLVGDKEYTVIDPGPNLESHVNRITHLHLKITSILLTHYHKDHAESAQVLSEKLSIPIYAPLASAFDPIDNLIPDQSLQDNDLINVGQDHMIAVHTPGHASNHFCYFLPKLGALFAGDHIMNGSTVIINPPDGDMRNYIKSLIKVRDLPLETIYPGHGEPITSPFHYIESLVDHRKKREVRVLENLDQSFQSLDELVKKVYLDKKSNIYPIAKRSLEAHLIKLERDDLALSNKKGWQLKT